MCKLRPLRGEEDWRWRVSGLRGLVDLLNQISNDPNACPCPDLDLERLEQHVRDLAAVAARERGRRGQIVRDD